MLAYVARYIIKLRKSLKVNASSEVNFSLFPKTFSFTCAGIVAVEIYTKVCIAHSGLIYEYINAESQEH